MSKRILYCKALWALVRKGALEMLVIIIIIIIIIIYAMHKFAVMPSLNAIA